MTMKRLLLLLLPVLLLAGCGRSHQPPLETTESTVAEILETETRTEEERTEPEQTAVEDIPTQPEHSPLYLEGIGVEDVILWFQEVCLDAEFVTGGGDPSRLQKWAEPIVYRITGPRTQEDLLTLEGFCLWLNTVEGFPGIREAEPEEAANLRIRFGSEEEMLDRMGDNFYGCDGCVTFWYIADEIYDGDIFIREDLDQFLRNSVILEELYNGLGPVQDSMLRPDSIIAAQYSMPQALTAVDELILKLLYHPDMLCGMTAEECQQVIRSLYY